MWRKMETVYIFYIKTCNHKKEVVMYFRDDCNRWRITPNGRIELIARPNPLNLHSQ